MRVREFRKNIWRSLDTTVRVSNRAQLVRYISAKLGRDGAPIPDDLIHVTHYGYDDRIDWDEHIIVVEGSGVFGFTDAPCPPAVAEASAGDEKEVEKEFDEIVSAFAPAPTRSHERRHSAPTGRTPRATMRPASPMRRANGGKSAPRLP